MAEQRVVVEVHLGIERHHLLVAGNDQRVDFRERCVGVVEGLIQCLQEIARLCHAFLRHADLAGDVLGVIVGNTLGGILDDDLVDLFGGLGRHFLDIHAAFAGSH
ncbi:hypothetical protein D3C83_37130 [compost metagenome]